MNEVIDRLRERAGEWKDLLHFSPTQRRSLLAVGVVIILLSAFFVVRGRSTPVSLPLPSLAPLVITPATITVDVAGGVARPGVYTLDAESRVIDALKAAGGAKAGTDLSDLNLARIMKDGEQIYVEPVVTQSGVRAVVSRPKVKTGPLNINRATEAEFDSLPGIGPVIAARITAYRKSNGPFSAVEDLQKVSGIGAAKFAQIKNKVRV